MGAHAVGMLKYEPTARKRPSVGARYPKQNTNARKNGYHHEGKTTNEFKWKQKLWLRDSRTDWLQQMSALLNRK